MTTNIKTFALLLFLASSVPLYAQDTNENVELPDQPQNAISIVPQYAFIKGIRVDYEKRINNGDHWLVISPQLYSDIDGNNLWSTWEYSSYETMLGFGLNVYFKSIAFKSDNVNWTSGLPRHSLYLQAGPNYQHYSLKNSEEVAVPFLDNGITYYRFDVQEIKKPINRFGAAIDMGWQFAFDRFLLDLYLGLAVKYSFDGNGELIKPNYSSWVDKDYSGILMDGGVRIGMFF